MPPPNTAEIPPVNEDSGSTEGLPTFPGTGGAVDLEAAFFPNQQAGAPEGEDSEQVDAPTTEELATPEEADETSKERFWRRAGVVAGISMIATGAAAALNLIPENSIGDLPDAVRIGGSIAYGLAGINTLHTHAKGSFKSAAERVSNRLRRTLKPDATEEQA